MDPIVFLPGVIVIMFIFSVVIKKCNDNKNRNKENRRCPGRSAHCVHHNCLPTQQEQNIYNISGRVAPATNPTQYPDAYLSVDHITVTNELNKPPKYDDAPPSYEEAIKIALAQSNSLQTLQTEQAQVRQDQSSTSSSTPPVVPVVLTRTTE